MTHVPRQGVAHFLRRQDEIHQARVDRRRWHALEIRRRRILHDDEPSTLVDIFDSARAIAPASGQHNRHAVRPDIHSQRSEENIDRQA
jgi:hypothetical protein